MNATNNSRYECVTPIPEIDVKFELDTAADKSISVSEHMTRYGFKMYTLNDDAMDGIKEEVKHEMSNELTKLGPIRTIKSSGIDNGSIKKLRNPYSYLPKKNDNEVTTHEYIARLHRSIDEQRKQLEEGGKSIARLQQSMNLILERTGLSEPTPKSLDQISVAAKTGETICRPVLLNDPPAYSIVQSYKNAPLPNTHFPTSQFNNCENRTVANAGSFRSFPTSQFDNSHIFNEELMDRDSTAYQDENATVSSHIQQISTSGAVKHESSIGNYNPVRSPATYNTVHYFPSFHPVNNDGYGPHLISDTMIDNTGNLHAPSLQFEDRSSSPAPPINNTYGSASALNDGPNSRTNLQFLDPNLNQNVMNRNYQAPNQTILPSREQGFTPGIQNFPIDPQILNYIIKNAGIGGAVNSASRNPQSFWITATLPSSSHSQQQNSSSNQLKPGSFYENRILGAPAVQPSTIQIITRQNV